MLGEPSIGDYGVIGDCRSAALVDRHGAIDWCCLPDFDSPAVFCRLLDREKGGYWEINPDGFFSTSRRYVENTNVLETIFHCETAEARLLDFMPIAEDGTRRPFRILRLIEGIRGSLQLRVRFNPTFDFARGDTRLTVEPGALVAVSGSEILALCSKLHFEIQDGLAEAWCDISPSQRIWLALSDERGCAEYDSRAFEQELAKTCMRSQTWLARLSYSGSYRDLVDRSALVLKLLTYEPSGAIIAAPTTSLPERLGGDLNWDYRYTWLRDSSLTLDVLQRLGFHDESVRFFDWMLSICLCGGVQPVYTIRGERDLAETTLVGLAGYRNSRPVRVGNMAACQNQYDIYGDVLEAAWLCYSRMPRGMKPEFWDVLVQLAHAAMLDWQRPSQGLWEVREKPRHWLYVKLLCWVALDRAIRLAEFLQLDGPLVEWRDARDKIRNHVLQDGFNEKLGVFTSVLGGETVDPSLLVLALSGCVDCNDPRMQATATAIRRSFEHRGLLYREIPGPGQPWQREGAFILCTCWLIDYLALSGNPDEASKLLSDLLGYANDLGLFAEEIDPVSGKLLGNFPQGFSHLAITRSILNISGGNE
jgi:GH15 family glucan-1,4-alpha-glucosidase